jgi:broad specificity phosphatase PhoE
MTKVRFIRHGESIANAGLATASPAEARLTYRGLEQAYRIATSIEAQPSLIVTSSYVRTIETALPTLRRFPRAAHQEWDVHEFTYLSQTKTNKHYTTVQDRKPLVDAFWERCDPFYATGEGAESFADFIERVKDVLYTLKYCREDFVVVFSHEQFIQAALWLSSDISLRINRDTMRAFREHLLSSPIPNSFSHDAHY